MEVTPFEIGEELLHSTLDAPTLMELSEAQIKALRDGDTDRWKLVRDEEESLWKRQDGKILSRTLIICVCACASLHTKASLDIAALQLR
jgi:hypothetical protein